MAPLIFEIIADFKVQAGAAVLESRRVQEALDGISGSAQTALNAVSGLGANLAASFGLGSLSAIGGIGKAVQISEKFNQTVTNFSSIITSNREVFAGDVFDSFANRVRFSTQMVRDLSVEANRLGVREATLFNTFKSIGFIGLQGGLQVDEIQKLAANVQLAAPVTGLDPSIVGDQLFRLALQGVSGSPRLFKTLLADTQTFNQFKGKGGTREFGQLDFTQRVQLLSKAFAEFAARPEILARRINTLAGQVSILSNRAIGLTGALKPIGDSVIPIFVDGLKIINRVIAENIIPSFKNFAKILENLRDGPLEILKDLQQLASVRADVNLVAGVLKLIPNILIASLGFGLLNRTFLAGVPILGTFIGVLNSFFTGISNFILKILAVEGLSLAPIAAASGVFGKLFAVLRIGFAVVGRLSTVIFALFFIFQVLTRAASEFRQNIAKFFLQNAERISAIMLKFQIAISAIIAPIQGAVESLGSLLGSTFILEFLLDGLITLADIFANLFGMVARGVVTIEAFAAAFATLLGGIFAAATQLASGNFAQAQETINTLPEEIGKSFLDRIQESGLFGGAGGAGEGPINPVVTHTGDVIINNDIKEAFEPDRIAFTITEQINKALTRPTTSRDNSFNQFGGSVIQGAR